MPTPLENEHREALRAARLGDQEAVLRVLAKYNNTVDQQISTVLPDRQMECSA